VRLQFDYVITQRGKGTYICIGFTKHCALNLTGTPVACRSEKLIMEIVPRLNQKKRYASDIEVYSICRIIISKEKSFCRGGSVNYSGGVAKINFPQVNIIICKRGFFRFLSISPDARRLEMFVI